MVLLRDQPQRVYSPCRGIIRGHEREPSLSRTGTIARFPFDNDQVVRNDYWSLKVTARPSDQHSLEFSLFGDPSRRYLNEGYAVSVDSAATKTRRYQAALAAPSSGL